MHFSQYYPVDVVNGPGTRCTLFVSGCEHQCRGCYNQKTWCLTNGQEYTIDLENRIIEDLKDTRIRRRGLSLTGGDPLHPNNLSQVLNLIRRVKQECPDKDIWMWTGYCYGELSREQRSVVSLIDVVIDGKFEQNLYNPSLKWRGSSNQKIVSVKDGRILSLDQI